MRSVLVAGQGALAVALALTACGDSPTGPTSNVSTILIVGQLSSQSFSPNPALVGGQMVAWRNSDGLEHHIVANDGSFDTGLTAPGATSATVQIPPEGLNYHCMRHPTRMFGAIGGANGEVPTCTGEYCCCQ